MSQETNNDLYPEPIIANTKSTKAALRLVILGVLLVGVSILYFIYRDQLGQQFLLGLLGTLAMTGVFYLFGSAINVIQFTPRGTSDELTRAFVDTFPEGTVVTDQKGRIVYANRAYAQLTGVTNSSDVQAIEHILSSESAASDPIYRLANAVRDGVSGQEELRLSRPLDPAREPVPTWYRVKARAVAGIPGQTAPV
ncbi:MAG: PAS domain-containing protein, partial [Pyrinomonadaceae bacterium]